MTTAYNGSAPTPEKPDAARETRRHAEFNAEQAVKNRLGKRHVSWFHIQRGLAVQPVDGDVLNAYREALIDAHRRLEEELGAVRAKYVRDHELSERDRRAASARYLELLTDQQARLIDEYGRSAEALRLVLAAERAGRKTVRIADILAEYRREHSDSGPAAVR